MARMIPSVDPGRLEHGSEVPVYVALRDQLPNEFTVLHSFPWLRPWRDERALAEGETDFVILHRFHGLLVLEVKGGRGIRHDGQRWFRTSSHGEREFRDPFKQARRNMHALVQIVEERSGNRIRRRDFAYGYAVVFPHVDYEGEPPPHADRAIVISRRHLPKLEQAVLIAYKAWGGYRRTLSQIQYDTLLTDCLMPKFRIIRRIGPDIASASDRLLELTEQQAQLFEGLYAQDRVLVEGVAGSGKTFLALHRAIAFARMGRRTLFVCFNRALAEWLRCQVLEDARSSGYRPFLTIRNFHALANGIVSKAGLAANLGNVGQLSSHFWDEEVPELLEQAVLEHDVRGSDVRYDALVIDEAQDFPESWWYILTESLLRHETSPIFAFMDPNQSLRGRLQPPPIRFETKFLLSINCRNTRKIATASASLLNLTSRSFNRSPRGPSLRVLRAHSIAQQKGLVINELKRLLAIHYIAPHQIVLIGPSGMAKSSISNVGTVCGVPLTTNFDTWRDGRGLLVATSRSFKGLEADVVLLYDLGDFNVLFQKNDLYVACTRAKSLLIAIVHGSECRSALELAARVAEEET